MRDATATRNRIHAAALTLFVDRGVTETSVRDLAQAAQIAEGTLYRHYASKDDLVADLFLTNYTAFTQRLQAVQAGHITLADKMAAVVADIYRFHDADPTLFRFLLLVQHQALPRLTDDVETPVTVLTKMVTDAQESLVLADPVLATALILGLILQPATFVAYGRLSAPLLPWADQVARACLRVLRPAE